MDGKAFILFQSIPLHKCFSYKIKTNSPCLYWASFTVSLCSWRDVNIPVKKSWIHQWKLTILEWEGGPCLSYFIYHSSYCFAYGPVSPLFYTVWSAEISIWPNTRYSGLRLEWVLAPTPVLPSCTFGRIDSHNHTHKIHSINNCGVNSWTMWLWPATFV